MVESGRDFTDKGSGRPIVGYMTRSEDKVIELAWRLTLGFLITAAGCVALFLLHQSFFDGLEGHWAQMGYKILGSLLIGGAVWWLCVYRDDLIGDY